MFLWWLPIVAVFGISRIQAAAIDDFFVFPNERRSDIGGRIIGGTEAPAHAFPYQVGIYCIGATQTHFCGGSLISTSYVLTAAHCVETAISVELVFGAHEITETEASQVRRTSSDFTIHQGWNESALINDLALIKLAEPVEETDYIKVINIAAGDESYAGKQGNITGWGRLTNDQQGVTPILRYLEGNILSNDACKAIHPSYDKTIKDTHLCISGQNPTSINVGTCNGDSGGPLVVDGVQVGLVSFGYNDCEAGLPSVFTRLTEFTAWLGANSDLSV